MNFDGGGNATTNAKATYSVNAGDQALINVGATKSSPAQSTLTMNANGIIDLSGKTNIKLKIDDDTYIEMSAGLIKLNAKNINVIGTESSTIGKDAEANIGIKINDDINIKAKTELIAEAPSKVTFKTPDMLVK